MVSESRVQGEQNMIHLKSGLPLMILACFALVEVDTLWHSSDFFMYQLEGQDDGWRRMQAPKDISLST